MRKHLLLMQLVTAVFLTLSHTIEAQPSSYASVPYSTGFESATLDANWYTTSSTSNGRIQIWNSSSLTWGGVTAQAHTGTYWLGMDASPGGSYVTNESWMGLDLAGQSNVRLSFWWAEWNDETSALDGIYISDDGGTSFTKVLDLNGGSYVDLNWYHFDMSLDSLNNYYGLNFTSTYVVKFQQYDNYYFAGGNDGFLFDDIDVYIPCSTVSTISPVVCSSYTVPSGNQTYYTSGTYYDTLINAANCDSIITVNLTVNNTYDTLNPVECYSYTSPSGNYTWTSTGMYMDTLPNSLGCDSVITIDLIVNDSSSATIAPVACDSYTSPSGNYTWASSGTYMDTILNSAGCDSIITIDLTVHYSSFSNISPVVCDSYTSPSGMYNWTSSGTYMDTIPNAMGCDSVVTIDLTVNTMSFDTIDVIGCGSYVSPSGNYTWSIAGTYMDTIPNAVGCDSVITVHLTIGGATTASISPEACMSYTSPSGNYVWEQSGSYTDTIVNSMGCDSLIIVNLTINEVEVGVTDNSPTLVSDAANASYQWLDCSSDYAVLPGETAQSFTATQDGEYAVEVTEGSCVDTSACIIVNSIGVVENRLESEISLYPNPTRNAVTLDLGSVFTTLDVRVLNIVGQAVSVKKYSNVQQVQLEIEGAPGVYFVEVSTTDNRKTILKVIKE